MENTACMENESVTLTVFVVAFQGEFVECLSSQDALAIHISNRLLSGNADLDDLAIDIDFNRLALAIERYGLEDAASRLRQLAHARGEREYVPNGTLSAASDHTHSRCSAVAL